MLVKDIERGVHSVTDWSKRLTNSYVYGTILNSAIEKPSVIYIKAMGEINDTSVEAFHMADMYYKVEDSNTNLSKLANLDILSFKPDPGIYNLERFPVMASHLPFRQWHFGVTPDSFSLTRLAGHRYNFGFDVLESCFNPIYPTLADAIDRLKQKERKHIAISNKVSLLVSGAKLDRIMLMYNFIPIATVNNGMWFPSQTGRPLEKVAMEYKDKVLALL